ncbi:YheC/YheD family protein [Paenibacillus fonticola]|uniref:YheC/YheD family endospore coat-associated protein n=1 Tax=Paenibacillus fonticola TaxID=379896 RepID=UPI000367CAF3|nr:YheC/YheD family protein [Paenibacillus fonticola]
MNSSSHGIVGIMAGESTGPLPFSESAFCRHLCHIGNRQKLTVYVFCPSWVTPSRRGVPGYTYENGKWIRKLFPAPDIIYDRCFSFDKKQQRRKQRCMDLLTGLQPFVYLTRGLAGKWSVYQALKKNSLFSAYLPHTVRYETTGQLDQWLKFHQGEAFLKPQNGTHGKRTMYVKVVNSGLGEGLLLIGRDGGNQLFRKRFYSRQDGLEWIHKFIGSKTFLLQPYLLLNNSKGEPFDVRVLMQKNENGVWSMTGMAVRAGRKHSLTSNLHGGGTAHRALPFLTKELGEHTGQRAAKIIRNLSQAIPEQLESYFGRLAELGIDFGVDQSGQVWILEVNSKPGRSSLFRIGDMQGARKSVENPIQYARYLLLHKT